jgi:hypothetical protein
MHRFVAAVLGAVVAVALAFAGPSPAAAASVSGVDLRLKAGPNPGTTDVVVRGTVRDPHGQPVAGAGVFVCGPYSDTQDECSEPDATTGPLGRWTVHVDPRISSGAFYATASAPSAVNLLHSETTWFNTNDGPAMLDLVLRPAVTITGVVHSLEPAPIAGVSVAAICPEVVVTAETAADGRFTILQLPPGVACSLDVSAPAGATFLSGWYKDGTVVRTGAGTDVDTGDAGATGIDIALPVGRTIAGSLDGANGLPIQAYAFGDNGGASAAVGADGGFTLAGLWPGVYRLTFKNTAARWDYGQYVGDGVPVRHEVGEAVDVSSANILDLKPLLSVATIEGTLRDAAGAVAGEAVNVCSQVTGCPVTRSASNGAFRFAGVPAQDVYRLTAGDQRHVTVFAVAGGATVRPPAPVTFQPGTATRFDMRLPTGGSITGRVTRAGGTPVAGANVTAHGTDHFGRAVVRRAKTHSDGRYRISGLAAATYQVCAHPPVAANLLVACRSSVVVLDPSRPVLSTPAAGLVTGTRVTTAAVPIRIRWTGIDDQSGIDGFYVQRSLNGAAWTSLGYTPSPFVEEQPGIGAGVTRQYRVHGRNGAGVYSGWTTPLTFRLGYAPAAGTTWSGAWTTVPDTDALGGSHRVATDAGAGVRVDFTGRAIGWVAATGPDRGKVAVYVDGSLAATVDLGAGPAVTRKLVFTKSWASSGLHRIRLANLATDGRPGIDVDAFLVLR